jgi:hypothetical protein
MTSEIKRKAVPLWPTIGSLLVAVLAIVVVVDAIGSHRKRVILHERIQDVRALLDAYDNVTNATDIRTLITYLSSKGITLHSPIPKDPTKPCYRLIKNKADSSPLDPRMAIIEETNTVDKRRIVKLFGDGSIQVQLLKQ